MLEGFHSIVQNSSKKISIIHEIGKFWDVYKNEIIWGLIVVSAVLILRFLTNKGNELLQKKALEKNAKGSFPGDLVQRILNALWMVLGVIALFYIFGSEENQQVTFKNFEKVGYLGFVSVTTIVAASLTKRWFRHTIESKISNEEDTTSYKFLRYVAVFCVYFIGFLLAILAFPALRGLAHTALGGASVVAIVAGIASKEALANVIAGVFIIAFKPFKLGDAIQISDKLVGTVSDITLRHTVIRNYENKMIVIPNSIMSNEKIINFDFGDRTTCEWIEVAISYESDIDLAKHIMREECEAHPNILDHRSEIEIYNGVPKVLVRVIRLDDSGVTVRAWCWALNYPEAFVLKCEVLESIKKRFDKEGVKIPYPHRTMVFKKKQLDYLKGELIPEKEMYKETGKEENEGGEKQKEEEKEKGIEQQRPQKVEKGKQKEK